MSQLMTSVTRKVSFIPNRSGRRPPQNGSGELTSDQPGTVPRVSRLMALALRFDGLIRSGSIADRAELARVGHVTRARVTQIMNLLHLAPDIQEAILFLPRTTQGSDPIHEHDLRSIVAEVDWARQRRKWATLNAVRYRPGALQTIG